MARDLAFESLQQQLRDLQLEVATLKRLQPSGKGLEFDATLIPPAQHPVAWVTDGFYVRINNVVHSWTKHYIPLGSGSAVTGTSAPWRIPLPFPMTRCGGTWSAKQYNINITFDLGPIEHIPGDGFFKMWDTSFDEYVRDSAPFNWAALDGSILYTQATSIVVPGF